MRKIIYCMDWERSLYGWGIVGLFGYYGFEEDVCTEE
jgi:hypothetical protein